MSELDKAIKAAYDSEGSQQDVNQVYVILFRVNIFMPAYRQDDEDEPFTPLYIKDNEKYFIPIFDSLSRLKEWGKNEYDELDYVEILGADIIRGVGDEDVYLCLNPGTDYYKEFSPDEIRRLKLMLSKIDQLKSSTPKS